MNTAINIPALSHRMDSEMAYAIDKRHFVIVFRAAKGDPIEEVRVLFGDKYLFTFQRQETLLEKKEPDSLYDYYEATLELKSPRLAYVFRVSSGGKQYFFSESGLTEKYDFSLSYRDFFQCAYINECDLLKVPSWCRSAVFYEIFVDRFAQDGSSSPSDLLVGASPLAKSHGGGNLRGVISKLPYLQELGITALYLTPIFLSPSNHKYDTEDYYSIDPSFGTKEDLLALVKASHQRGIKVILDAVFNHCSEKNPWFQDVKKKGRDSKYYSYFLIDGPSIKTNPPNYEMFASCSYMPKINTSDPGARKDLIEIALHYLRDFEIDGWRLDVSDEVSHLFWREFNQAIKKENKDAIIIGENWHSSSSYCLGDQFDSVMNYPFLAVAESYFGRERVSAEETANRLNALLRRYSFTVDEMMLNLLDSHDTVRFINNVGFEENILLSAIALMVFYPGMPCLYYGDELPLEGKGDPDNRRLFPWGEEGKKTAYRLILPRLLSLKQNKAFQEGEARISSFDGLLAIKRGSKEGSYALYINMSGMRKGLPSKGAPILSSLASNEAIEPKGFAIIKERKQ